MSSNDLRFLLPPKVVDIIFATISDEIPDWYNTFIRDEVSILHCYKSFMFNENTNMECFVDLGKTDSGGVVIDVDVQVYIDTTLIKLDVDDYWIYKERELIDYIKYD